MHKLVCINNCNLASTWGLYVSYNIFVNLEKVLFNPCKNGGLWALQTTDFQCHCRPGFTGTNCESGLIFYSCFAINQNYFTDANNGADGGEPKRISVTAILHAYFKWYLSFPCNRYNSVIYKSNAKSMWWRD